jgi:hypothetical protein
MSAFSSLQNESNVNYLCCVFPIAVCCVFAYAQHVHLCHSLQWDIMRGVRRIKEVNEQT